MIDFWIKQGDTLPSLDAVLKDSKGTPVDLTTATAVRFDLRRSEGGTLLGGAAALRGGVAGGVRYNWAPADTTIAGIYNGEFVVTFPGGKEETFPSQDSIVVQVVPEV